jgi:Tfp pilus assembly PilM family ATPase
MTIPFNRLKDYLTKPPSFSVAFQISHHYLSGIHVSPKETKIKSQFILPLDSSALQPSFDKINIADDSYLEGKIKEGVKQLKFSEKNIAILLPESCLKVFVFSFASLPSSQKEKEEIIHWRVKKQIPLLPDDTRLSFTVLRSNKEEKVLVSLARASVVQEYESFFTKIGLRVGIVGVATLNLLNLIDREEGDNFIVINLEEDYISLMAFLDSEIALYRVKPLVRESQAKLPFSKKIEDIVKEIKNTANFVEDREKKKINTFWVRLGIVNPEEEILPILKERLAVPLKAIEALPTSGFNFHESQILSPLIGQIL